MSVRRTVIVAVTALTTAIGAGCSWGNTLPGSFAYQRRMNEERPEADRRVDSLETVIRLKRDTYFACSESYARQHAKSSAAPREIADAAAAGCHNQYSEIAQALSQQVDAAVFPYRYDPVLALEVREKWESSTAQTLRLLGDQAHDRAVRAVVEGRP